MAATLLLRNQHILQSLNIVTNEPTEPTVTRERSQSRPHSPVKMLTSLFNGAVSRDPYGYRKSASVSTASFSEIPALAPTTAAGLGPAFDSRPSTKVGPSKATVGVNTPRSATDEIDRLERILSSYVLALHARKGNVVGRVLRSRAAADELTINELYNALLESPENHEMPAQVSVDVLFAAFEKFLKGTWFDKMGPVISQSTWKTIQSKLDSMDLGDFEEVFRACLADIAPQNQRALRQIIRLLNDLLRGTNNDGDRGIITASFAELLAPDGNANEFVSLLDRMVDDVDTLLSEPTDSSQATPYGSIGSSFRLNTSKTGSLTSATSSSLRKKFGLGLTRKSGKAQGDGESETISVWRTLSKSKHSDHAKSSSLSKASAAVLGRSNSDVQDARMSPKRPVSRERPTILGAFAFEPASPLGTIGENAVSGPPRKKRRSSVSDLRSLQASAVNTPVREPLMTPSKLNLPEYKNSPMTPSPIKLSQIPTPSKGDANTSMLAASPARRDGSPLRGLPRPLNITKTQHTPVKQDEVTITSHSPQRRLKDGTSTGIPTFKAPTGLSERPTSGNVRKLPPTPGQLEKAVPEKSVSSLPAPPAKLRMQSPQKLRERLAQEQEAIQSADTSLQDELSKIGEELRQLTGRSPPKYHGHARGPSGTPSTAAPSAPGQQDARTAMLEKQLATLAVKHGKLASTTISRLDSLHADIASSLQVSEARSKSLDALYREANAENEALYSRFNEELAKVVGRVRTADGVHDEMRRRVKECEEESARLRRENGRLKREVVGLRAQLRE